MWSGYADSLDTFYWKLPSFEECGYSDDFDTDCERRKTRLIFNSQKIDRNLGGAKILRLCEWVFHWDICSFYNEWKISWTRFLVGAEGGWVVYKLLEIQRDATGVLDEWS